MSSSNLFELKALVSAGKLNEDVYNQVVKINTEPKRNSRRGRRPGSFRTSNADPPSNHKEGEADPAHPLVEGLLYVRRSDKEPWKRKHVMLFYDHLEWAPNQAMLLSSKPSRHKDSFDLNKEHTVRRCEDDYSTFEVLPAKKPLQFAADSEKEIRKWLQGIKRVIDIAVRADEELNEPVLLNRPCRSLSQVSRDWLQREQNARKEAERRRSSLLIAEVVQGPAVVVPDSLEEEDIDAHPSAPSQNDQAEQAADVATLPTTNTTTNDGMEDGLGKAVDDLDDVVQTLEDVDESLLETDAVENATSTLEEATDASMVIPVQEVNKELQEANELLSKAKEEQREAAGLMSEAVDIELRLAEEERDTHEALDKAKEREAQIVEDINRLRRAERAALDKLARYSANEQELTRSLDQVKGASPTPGPSDRLMQLLHKDGQHVQVNEASSMHAKLASQLAALGKNITNEKDRLSSIESDRTESEKERRQARQNVVDTQTKLQEVSAVRMKAGDKVVEMKAILELREHAVRECEEKVSEARHSEPISDQFDRLEE